MITKIEDVASNVAAFKATGNVTKDDYDKVLLPELDRINKLHGHIHFLFVLETPVKNFSAGAWLQDALAGLKHYRGLKKVAIVTDENIVKSFTDKFSFLIPGKSKGFKLSEIEAAKLWVATED